MIMIAEITRQCAASIRITIIIIIISKLLLLLMSIEIVPCIPDLMIHKFVRAEIFQRFIGLHHMFDPSVTGQRLWINYEYVGRRLLICILNIINIPGFALGCCRSTIIATILVIILANIFFRFIRIFHNPTNVVKLHFVAVARINILCDFCCLIIFAPIVLEYVG